MVLVPFCTDHIPAFGFLKKKQIQWRKAIKAVYSHFTGLESGVSPSFKPELGILDRLVSSSSFPWMSETLAHTKGAMGKRRVDTDGLSINFHITSNGSFSTALSRPAGCSSLELVSCIPGAAWVVRNIVQDMDGLELGLVATLALMLWWERKEGPSEPSSKTSAMY